MEFQAWQLAVLEEYGYTNTNDGLINRVACSLANRPSNTIEPAEFRRICIACNVDPDSFTQRDLEKCNKSSRNETRRTEVCFIFI